MKRLIRSAGVALALLAAGASYAQSTSDFISGLAGRLAGPGGAGYVGYSNGATGSVARTVAKKLGDRINAADFGVVCDGSTDDAANLNKALTYAGTVTPSFVMLPNTTTNCMVGSTVTVPTGVTLWGNGGESAGLSAKVLNLNPMISLAGNGSSLREMYVRADAAGTNASGVVVQMPNAIGQIVDHVYVQGGCTGIDINGNQPIVSNSIINGTAGTGCHGMVVGRLTTGATTTDARIDKVTVAASQSSPPDDDLLILDVGGLLVTTSDMLFAKVGTHINPGTNQAVLWATMTGTYAGDTNVNNAFLIDTAAASANVQGMECMNCWMASAQAAGATNLVVQNTGGGGLAGLHWTGARIYNAAQNGVSINAGTNVSFDASRWCGNGRTATGSNVFFNTNVSNWAVRDSTVGSTCDGFTSSSIANGILMGGGNSEVVITGNDFTGAMTNQVAGTPIGNSVVANNTFLSNSINTIASAATINPGAFDTTAVSGTATISTINGAWNGRRITLIPTAPWQLATGGNVCSALTATTSTPVTLVYGGCWYVK
ncbi:hypothetical protein [Burkholderia metallica]|uniref:hypothetical protein n=1 Tax=Burkholderia metallica TaxID=488729 RepID=UPI000D1B5E16|nr:hypothetical protein [Burkholderia metallica]